VPAGASVLKSIKLNGISHTFAGDLMFVLETPNGHKHNLLTTQPADPNVDFNNNNFEIVDQEETCASGVPPFNWAAGAASSGTYAQTFGGWTSGNFGIFNTPIEQIPIESGTWTLYVYDWVGLDVGSLTSWDLCFGDPAVPPTPGSAPTLVSPANGATIYGPVTLSWNAASCATSYEIDVDGEIYGPLSATTYTFSPAAGVHTWKVRGLNASGAGPDSTSQSFTAVMPPSGCNGSSLTTLFVSNNGGSAGGQVFFDVNVTNAAGITVAQLDTNTSLAAGTQFGMDVYTKSGSFVGSENNSGAWTLSASGSGISAGTDQASLVEFTDFVLAPGSHGVALVMVGAAHRYSGTSASPPPTFFSNADLSITGGKALNVPWTGTPFSPRMWNGTVRYDCTSPVSVTDCQLLPTVTQSCSSVAGWSGSPSASSASPFTLTFSGLNAQVNGVVFYGINGPSSASWSPESNLCIKAPTQRLNGVSGAFGSTGGSIGSCNGQYSFDMNAVIQGFGYLGTPMAAGQMVEVQAWERDPASSKTTNLSDALSFTVGP
jgi:hypothetical protein